MTEQSKIQEMKKETVYIPLTTPEECKKATTKLTNSGEKFCEIVIGNNFKYLGFDKYMKRWDMYNEEGIEGKTPITIDQLEELLGGEKLIRAMKEYADQQTSSLRKELSELHREYELVKSQNDLYVSALKRTNNWPPEL